MDIEVKERVTPVCLIKESPSSYLMNLFDRQNRCIDALAYIEHLYYTPASYDVMSLDDRRNAQYWILRYHGFDYDSDEMESMVDVAFMRGVH